MDGLAGGASALGAEARSGFDGAQVAPCSRGAPRCRARRLGPIDAATWREGSKIVRWPRDPPWRSWIFSA
jgi:hypothetical protein